MPNLIRMFKTHPSAGSSGTDGGSGSASQGNPRGRPLVGLAHALVFWEFCTFAPVTFGPHPIHNRKGDKDDLCS